MSLFRKKQKTIKEKIKKGNYDDFDNFDNFDDFDNLDLGLDDLDGDIVSKKRSPVTRVGKGILKGIKSHFLDFRRHKREILKHFPDAVSDTLDMIDESVGSIADQIRESARDSSGDVRNIIQSVDRIVPSKYKRLKNKTSNLAQRLRDNVTENDISTERAQEDSISRTLEEVFNATSARDEYSNKVQSAQFAISEKLENERHKQTTFQLGKIQEGVAMGNAFNVKVNTAFQKKLLELQFRSYYVQSNTFIALKEYSQASRTLLAGILKNTGLPDYVKNTEFDRAKQAARKELYGIAKDKLFSRNRYFNSLTEEATAKIKKINLGGIVEGLQGYEAMQETGMDPLEYLAELTTSEGILPKYSQKLIKKVLNKYVDKDSDTYRRIMEGVVNLQNPEKLGNELADYLENAQYDPNFAKSSAAKFLSPVIDILRNATSKASTKVKLNSDEDLLSASSYNKLTQLSITKVIPGYLARILQQNEKIGNYYSRIPLPELQEFNPYTGEFLRTSKMNKFIESKVNKELNQEGISDAYYGAASSFMEGKESRTAKSQVYKEVKPSIKNVLKQLSDTGKAINQLYTINKDNLKYNKEHPKDTPKPFVYDLDSSESKKALLKEITDLKKSIEDFYRDNVENIKPIASFPYNEYFSLLNDVSYIVNRVAEFERTLGNVSIKSSLYKGDKNFSDIAKQVQEEKNSRETKSKSISEYLENHNDKDRQLMSQFIAIANEEGFSSLDYKDKIRNNNFKNKLKTTYGFSNEEIERLSNIIKKSQVSKDSDAMVEFSSQVAKARELENTGATTVQNILDNTVEGRSKIGLAGYRKKDDETLERSPVARMGGIIKGIRKLAKMDDLRYWQTQILQNVSSKTTRNKFNLMLRELDPDVRKQVLEFLHDHGSNSISQVENMMNNMLDNFENNRDYNGSDMPLNILSQGITTEGEVPSSGSTFSSDRNLKYIKGNYNVKAQNANLIDQKGAAAGISRLDSSKVWTYKNDPHQVHHIGPMAQDVQEQLGDVVAPQGKKIDIPSMFGVTNMAIKELHDGFVGYKNSTTDAIHKLTAAASAYYTTDLNIRGMPGKSIKDIFDKSTSVESIVSVVGKAKNKTKDLLNKPIDEVVPENAREAVKGAKGRIISIGQRIKDKAAKVNKENITAHAKGLAGAFNDKLHHISNIISSNEDLKGGFLDHAAQRISKDADSIINANSSEERTNALSDLLVTLVAGGVEKIGEGGRFVHKKTIAKIAHGVVNYTKSIKGVGCMSNVYLGKTDLQNPVLFASNYTTTNPNEMYFDTKTRKRITSACHVRGEVEHFNGALVFTNAKIKEHGLYVLDANGKPIKLGGLKFMAAVGANALLRLGKFAVNKIKNNKYVKKVGKLADKITAPITRRLGLKGTQGWLHATIETLKGNNELLPYLDNKMQRMRHGTGMFPIVGRTIGKYSAMARDAVYGNLSEEEGHYSPEAIDERQHQKDVIKATRHYENIAAKNTPEKNQENYEKGVAAIGRKRISKAQKQRLVNLLHVRHFGIEHPDLKNVRIPKGKKKGMGSVRRFILNKSLRGMGYTAAFAMGAPLIPIATPLAGAYYAHKGYKKIKGLFHRKDKTVPENPEDIAKNKDQDTAIENLVKAHNEEDKEDKKFYDTKVKGQEVRRGGVRYMLSKMKHKGKHVKDKIIDLVKSHKGEASFGIMALLGMVADGIGKIKDVLKIGFDAIKDVPTLLRGLGSLLRVGFRLGKGAWNFGKKLFTKGGDLVEDGTADAAEAGEGLEAGAAGAAGIGALGTSAALLGAGAAGYAAGKYVVNPLINKTTRALTGGKDKTLGQALYHGVQDIKHFFTGGHNAGHYDKLRDNKNVPFGVKINNPGYIKDWAPQPHLPKVKGYVKFNNPEAGLMALGMEIKYYIDKGYNTLPKLINILNIKTSAEDVSHISGIPADETLNTTQPQMLENLIRSIVIALNGKQYYSPSDISTVAKTVSLEKNIKILNVKNAKKAFGQLSGNDGGKPAKTTHIVKKKKSAGGFFQNLFNFTGTNNKSSAMQSVKYAAQAKNYGIPGTKPQAMTGYTPPNPKEQLIKAQNLSLSQKQVISKIKSISSTYGFDAEYLLVVAAHESGLNPNAKNSEGSASGLYQYIDSTWQSKVSEYGKEFNLPYSASPFSIKASTLVAGASVKNDAATMDGVKSPATYLDVYLIHFLGIGGGPSFMKAMLQNPKQSAASVFPEQAQWNPEFFYDGGQALSLKGSYETIGNSFDTAAKQHGLKGRSTDIIGGHGKKAKPTTKTKPSTNLKKVTSDIVKKSKNIKAAQKKAPLTKGTILVTGKAIAKKTDVKGKAPVSTLGLPNVAQAAPVQAAPKPPAAAKKHVSTPAVVNLADEHNKLVAKANIKKTDSHAQVQTNHLSDISTSNKDIKTILHQQLLIQTQTLEYMKSIASSVNKGNAKSGGGITPKKTTDVTLPVRPVEPMPVVTPASLKGIW